MILNTQVKKNDFSTIFKPYIDLFDKLNYGDLNNDALWKWSSILYSIDTIGLKNSSICVDIGGGMSPLTKILSNNYYIINIDKYRGGNWFPLNNDGDYIKSIGIESKPQNIEYKDVDFFDWCKIVEDNSVDLMYDSCSVIHFNTKSDKSKNDGCLETIQQVERILKPGGYFIVVSDILHPIHINKISVEENKGEFLYFQNMLKLYYNGSMEIFQDIDETLDKDFYSNILQINPNLTNYNKLNHRFYEGKEDWQTFCHYEGSCQSNLTRGRFVFRKGNK